jgi:hypothetical protein
MLTLTVLSIAAIGTHPALAMIDDYIFRYSGVSDQDLLVPGGPFQATVATTVDNTGNIGNGDFNYIVGDCHSCGDRSFRNVFSFDLFTVTPPITSAALLLAYPANGFAGRPTDFIIHNITPFYFTHDLYNNAEGRALYNAIGTAPVMGSLHVDSTTNGIFVLIDLSNPYALAVLNNVRGQSIALGGTIVSSVPLPAGLPMFALALLGMFAGVQVRNQRKLA